MADLGRRKDEFPHAAAMIKAASGSWSEEIAAGRVVEAFGDVGWRTVDEAAEDIHALFGSFADRTPASYEEVVQLLRERLGALPHEEKFESFDDVAEQFYDQPIYPLLEHAMYLYPLGLERLRRVLSLVDEGPEGRVADLGVGPAVIGGALLRRLPGWALSGFDVSDPCVEYARAVLARRGLDDRGTVTKADARELPVPDASFDLVVATEIIEHVPDPARLLAEIARVLRPGGALIASAPIELPWGPHLSVFRSEAEVRALYTPLFDVEDLQVAPLEGHAQLTFCRCRLR